VPPVRASGRPRVLVVSPELPHDRVAHAGGRYVGWLVAALQERAEVLVAVPDVPVNRAADGQPGAPRHREVFGRRSERRAALRPVFRVLARLDEVRAGRDPSCLSWVLVAGLLTDRRVRRALRTADVVDLQWSQMTRLEPLVRILNRRARVLGTFHDARTQAFGRALEEEVDPGRRAGLERAVRSEARVQARLVRRLDAAVTFSEKDAVELAGHEARRVTVIPPPLADGPPGRRRRAEQPTVLFVGHLGRVENVEGLEWFLDAVWPLVRREAPTVALRVVGAGAEARLRARLRTAPSVVATGYVDDLAAEYAAAWLVVVPLRRGAGVKFKTVEALVSGVPVVTTPVGAEGVAEPERFAGVEEEAVAFAAACVRALLDNGSAERHAAAQAQWAREAFSIVAFREQVARLYLGTGQPLA
jgi:glycosyltransferase involved in cell wall biosynthesis